MVGLTVDIGFLWGVLSLEGGAALDPAALAHRADMAGADAVVLPLAGDDGPGFSVEEARRVRAILRKPLVIALRGTRLVKEAVSLAPTEVLFLSESGGPVELDMETAGSGPLSEATAAVRAAGVLPAVAVVPDEAGVLAAQDAGAGAVEISAAIYAAARTDDQALDAHRRIGAAARTAVGVGLRVRTGGGSPTPARVSRLAEIPEVEQVRAGATLLAVALYEGIGPAVASLRGEVERGSRRGERWKEEEEE